MLVSVNNFHCLMNQNRIILYIKPIQMYWQILNHWIMNQYFITSYICSFSGIVIYWIVVLGIRIELYHMVLYCTMSESSVLSNIESLFYESKSDSIVFYRIRLRGVIKYCIVVLWFKIRSCQMVLDLIGSSGIIKYRNIVALWIKIKSYHLVWYHIRYCIVILLNIKSLPCESKSYCTEAFF